MGVMRSKLDLKRSFVRHISHEVRTPLNTIVCGLKYLKSKLGDGNAGGDVAEYVALVNELNLSGNDAVEVLNEILLYDKIENKALTLDVSSFQVVPFVDNIVRPFNIQVLHLPTTANVIVTKDVSARLWRRI